MSDTPPPFADHFSGVAADYARSRPRYNDDLFAWLATLPARRERAWDVGTGSGQAALGLARHFTAVVASDASAAQLAAATDHPRIAYRVAMAQVSGEPPASVDLVTVAQALHWFDTAAFYAEVRRVLRPDGAIAVWTYALPALDDSRLDHALSRLSDAVDPWWPPERRHVDAGYRTLPFPFDEIVAPAFHLEASWSLATFLAYLRTWSSVTRCRDATGEDPVAAHEPALEAAWGSVPLRHIRWPISLRAGRLQRIDAT